MTNDLMRELSDIMRRLEEQAAWEKRQDNQDLSRDLCRVRNRLEQGMIYLMRINREHGELDHPEHQ